jgi:hypothetical protein
MRASVKIILILVSMMIIGSIIMSIGGYRNKQTIKTRVTDKESITQNSGDKINSFYVIYTEAGTFKLEDDMFYGNFNSSDWYGQIHRDSTYTFETIGYRIGILRAYPNIVNFK